MRGASGGVVLVVNLSPAWQRTLFFSKFQPGEVNRVRRVVESASGKGVNVARVLNTLRIPVRLLTVAGGHRGELFRRALAKEGISARIVPVRSETRFCQTLVASTATELVEEAAPLSRRELRAWLATFHGELAGAKWLVLTGTVPQGCGEEFYARLTRTARRQGVPVLLDAQRAQLMKAVRERPSLVKINRSELLAAAGKGGVAELLAAGAQCVVITRGAKSVDVYEGKARWRMHPPRVRAVNPVGSGDAMLAGICYGLCRGWSVREAVRMGMACGAANALTETAGVVRLRDLRRLFGEILDKSRNAL